MPKKHKLNILVMSGVEDGALLTYNSGKGDGKTNNEKWSLTIGRRDENDICLRNDTYVSRRHANLHWKNDDWWLEDLDSTNGTFLENLEDFFNDHPVKGFIQLSENKLFRVGRTWLRLQVIE